jgi:hypothetical protein
MAFKDSQSKMPLPVDQLSFDLGLKNDLPPGELRFLGGGGCWITLCSLEYLQFPMPDHRAFSMTELGHLVRITWIYTAVMNEIIMETRMKSSEGFSRMVMVAYFEQCLYVRTILTSIARV